MDEKVYKITLADGTVVEDLSRNGDNFISKTEITAEKFDGNCSPVVISAGITDETHENMELVQVKEMKTGEWWFVLRDISEQELQTMKLRSDIEYLAMMQGTEL